MGSSEVQQDLRGTLVTCVNVSRSRIGLHVYSGNGEGSQFSVLRGRAVYRCAHERRRWPTIERDGC